MGNKHSINLISHYDPSSTDWDQLTTYDGRTILRHAYTRQQMEEYNIIVYDQQQLNHERKIFQLRHNNNFLVATKYFHNKQHTEMCSSFYSGNIYIENIVLKLSQIDQIPFSDILHLYNQSLTGFQILFKTYGAFSVSEELICINKKAQVKVWCSSNLDQSKPDSILFQNGTTQQGMVYSIIKMIDANTNKFGIPFDISSVLLKSNLQLNFKNSIKTFEEIVRNNRLCIPCSLHSVQKLFQKTGGADPFEVIKMRQSIRSSQKIKPNRTSQMMGSKQQRKIQVQKSKIQICQKQQHIPEKVLKIPKPYPNTSQPQNIIQKSYLPISSNSGYSTKAIKRLTQIQTFSHNNNNQKCQQFLMNKPIIGYQNRIQQRPVHQQVKNTKLNYSNSTSKIEINNPQYLKSQSRIQYNSNSYYIPQQINKISHIGRTPSQLSNQNQFREKRQQTVQLIIKRQSQKSIQPQYIKQNNSLLPTAASFEMSATFNNTRLINSPSRQLSHSYQQLNIKQDSPLFHSDFKKKYKQAVGFTYKKQQLQYPQAFPKTIATTQLITKPIINNLNTLGDKYSSFRIKQQSYKRHLKSTTELNSSLQRQQQPSLHNLTNEIEKQQSQLAASLQSVSFKKQNKHGTSFSFDDLDNFFDDKKGKHTLSKKEFEEIEEELNQEMEQHLKNQIKMQNISIDEYQVNYLFEQKQDQSIISTSHKQKRTPQRPERPKSTKGNYANIFKTNTKISTPNYDQQIPEENSSQYQSSHFMSMSNDLVKDLMQLKKDDSKQNSSLHSISNLHSFG